LTGRHLRVAAQRSKERRGKNHLWHVCVCHIVEVWRRPHHVERVFSFGVCVRAAPNHPPTHPRTRAHTHPIQLSAGVLGGAFESASGWNAITALHEVAAGTALTKVALLERSKVLRGAHPLAHGLKREALQQSDCPPAVTTVNRIGRARRQHRGQQLQEAACEHDARGPQGLAVRASTRQSRHGI